MPSYPFAHINGGNINTSMRFMWKIQIFTYFIRYILTKHLNSTCKSYKCVYCKIYVYVSLCMYVCIKQRWKIVNKQWFTGN